MSKLTIHQKKWDILDANDLNCIFRINIDVLNEAFGVGRGMYAKAVYPDKKDTYILGNKPSDNFIIWMPKLYGNSSNWRNVLEDNGRIIREVADEGRREDWISDANDMSPILRIVFVKPDPKTPYRFAGVFENNDMSFCNHTYRRIATKIKLIGDPVSRIELIDDER